jgi:RNA polymerase sigma factor for flagellar operon FliA
LAAYLVGIATAMTVGILAGGSRENFDADGYDVTPEDRLAEAEILARIKEIVAELSLQERTLVERHYFAGETLDHAAKSLGLSKSWGSRLHARAIKHIAGRLRGSGISTAAGPSP